MPITAGQIINGVQLAQSIFGNKNNDKKQTEQQQRLNEINGRANREQADYEQQLKLKMWKDTNYGGQLAEADKAGVSKAAAIGGSGTGTQGASVAPVSGSGAADEASRTNAQTNTLNQQMMLASQINLMRAQKENIEADTANKKAGAGNTTVDTEGKTIDNTIKRTTKPSIEKTAEETANRTASEASIKANEETISNLTMGEQKRKVIAETLGMELENAVKDKKIKLTEQEIKGIQAKIEQGWKGLLFQGTDKVTGKYIELLADKLMKLGK